MATVSSNCGHFVQELANTRLCTNPQSARPAMSDEQMADLLNRGKDLRASTLRRLHRNTP
jgi:hypothetical protein